MKRFILKSKNLNKFLNAQIKVRKIFTLSLIFVFVFIIKIKKLFNFELFNKVRDKLKNFMFKF